MTQKENNIVLFSITLCWSSSYIFIKDLPENLSSFAYLTLTTGIAGIILIGIFFKKLHHMDKKTVLRGFIMSLLMAANLLAEKSGLELLPSSNASFIASLNVLLVPLILLFFHVKPTRNNTAGMIIILLGLFFTSNFHLSGFLNAGTVYMLLASLSMAFYTILSADFTKKSDPLQLGILQICFTAVIGFILWFFEEPATFASLTYNRRMLSSIFILAFFSKAYAYIMLMYSEKYATAFRVTVLASLEPVVTLILALLIPNSFGQTENFHGYSFFGALLITLGAIIANTTFLNKKHRAQEVLKS